MDYSWMHIQSYYIQYPPIYQSHTTSQKPIVASNNLVKEDIDCSKRMKKVGSKIQSLYSRSDVLQTYLILKNEGYNVCAKRK